MSNRSDAIGFFWSDEAKVKAAPKEKIKRTAPVRFWELPDYLPGLEEARAFKPNLFTDYELGQAALNKERLSFDSEIYPNYCLFAFRSIKSGKVVYFEVDNEPCGRTINVAKMRWVIENFCLVDFNGKFFDSVMVALALADRSTEDMYYAAHMLIIEKKRPNDVLRAFKVPKVAINDIDLIELTALAPGLKKCAGRLHAKRMQDLPFKPGTYLSEDQILILFRYCINDLDNTELLYHDKIPQIELREQTGAKYGIDLRSRSDAQMAEDIIASEIKRITGKKRIQRTAILPGTTYKYETPNFIKFESELLKWVLNIIQKSDFKIADEGNVELPQQLAEMVVKIGNNSYQFGIGGLHSQEKSIAHVADENYFIADTDATSYYPRLILNAGLTPQNLGKDFLVVYNGIVVQRVSAKEAGDIIVAECLKIVANGTFGKLGSPWSIVYAPNLMIQVTITGQLSIIMLAERFELNGIEVTSINTDGIVVKCLRSKEALFRQIVKQWEKDTGFGTEEIRYKATYSKDINNYIAVYEVPQKGKLFKTKGLYSETNPKKNAVNEICIEAIKQFLATGKLIDHTIRECKKISMFTTMRESDGGAVKDEIYLGKIIRWYYATGEHGEIISAKTGNRIARSKGAKPLMNLPDEFPQDVNYEWYIEECNKILKKIGYVQ